ncbi:MAG: recombinase family protein, partial [Oscillospiraceae bacterium]|nr:recombinase family protein [Oscillospiraceae bacterium]
MQKNSNNKNKEVKILNEVQCYRAALYARISRDDGDKSESDSIVNQRDLIKEYIKSKPGIKLVSERVDDGYSGVTFDRPSLNAMLDDVRSGQVNCIIVKDLSRFGRNYIEVGRYIGTLFPLLGVRFIAVNDGYDSADGACQANDYIIPFKNIINDAYCADISKKTRSQLEIKRKKGDFISPFVPFGYVRSKDSKNKLVIDKAAAAVITDIYKWKLSGMSNQGIADKLNSLGVLSPLEYKKSVGLGCSSAFKVSLRAKWSAVAIKRILCDEVYIGVLLQGKTTTPNYKIKNKIIKDKSEWVRVEDTHEAIISKEEFVLVADLLRRDVRNAPSKTTVYPFSGILFCSKCGHNLVRKVSTVDGVKYINNACLKLSKNDKRAGCPGIRIKEDVLFEIVTCAVRNHIKSVLDAERTIKVIDEIPQKQAEIQKLRNQAEAKRAEIEKIENRKVRLYEDYTDGEITRDEYESFKKNYDKQIDEAETEYGNLQKEIDSVPDITGRLSDKWIDYFKEYRDFTVLTREIIVKLIYKIIIYE